MLLQDVQSPGSAALQGLGSGQPLPAARVASSFDDLRPAEAQRVESGAWFSGLSLTLRQAVLSRSRVHRVRRGATLLKRGSVATDWIGVAGGALGLATQGRDGRGFTLDLLAPGDWYGDIALVDGGAVDLDIVAQTHSTVLLVDRPALQQLIHSQPELRAALLQLDCRRLRHMFRRLEELQTLARVTLEARQLSVVQAHEHFLIEAVGVLVAAGVTDGCPQDGTQGRFLLRARCLRAAAKTRNA